jgi:penicillin-binding protein 2
MPRDKLVSFIIAGVFLLLWLGLFNLQAMQGNRYRQLSEKNCIRLIPQQGSRGRIFDRSGKIIVTNSLAYDILLMPQKEPDLGKTLSELSGVLKTDAGVLRSAYRQNYQAPFMPVVILRDAEPKVAMAVEEMRFGLEVVLVRARPLRRYPYGELFAHVIGYLGEIDRWRLTRLADYGYKTKDVVGLSGIEERYDYYLRQEDGAQSVNVDHQGRFVRLLGFKPPKNGKDLQLALDLRIQQIAGRVLGGLRGCVIILQPASGEVLAMVSKPDFDPAVFTKRQAQGFAKLSNDRQAPFFNRAISGLYPPASVFKLVVAAAALESKKLNPLTQFFCAGSLKIGNRLFACWDVHSQQVLTEAVKHSCNIFFYHSGILTGAQVIHDYALRFGLGKLSGIDLAGEESGFVPSPFLRRLYRFQGWFDGDTANFAIGQGELLVTPLQVACLMAVFANRGYLVYPYLAKAIDGRLIAHSRKKPLRLPIKESTLDTIRPALRSVVSGPQGTASILADLAVAVAGKTGTAQASHGQPHGWFAGFFPYENPKFALCVFLEHGGSGYNACIVARRIIEEMITQGLL